jgi:nucleoid-associated protein YgaU
VSARLRGTGLALLALAALGAGAAEDAASVHEVKPGESLWTIAADRIGDPFLWPALYRANRDQIKDPATVYPGQKLAIPQLDAASREALRREAGLPENR